MGQDIKSYWRIQARATQFQANLKTGALIDPDGDPELQAAAIAVTRRFGRQTGINLAGFDFLFNTAAIDTGKIQPLFLEINYFFGRRGLGGSEAFYRLLESEIEKWLENVKRSNRSHTI